MKNETSNIVQNANSNNAMLGAGFPKLKEGETYCITCKQIIKSKNLDRHDNSVKHEKEVLKFANRMAKKTCA